MRCDTKGSELLALQGFGIDSLDEEIQITQNQMADLAGNAILAQHLDASF